MAAVLGGAEDGVDQGGYGKDCRPGLMQDPLCRNGVAIASMGYFQVPMLSYDMASSAR